MKIIGWIATILFMIFILYICSDVSQMPDVNKSFMVVYDVECTGCDISYINQTGGMSVQDGMRKWGEVFFAKGGTFVSVSAQNNRIKGKVKATIKINGQILATESCDGRYCIAAPNGIVKELIKGN